MDLSNSETRHIKKNGIEYLEFLAFDEFRDSMNAIFVIKGENYQCYFDPDDDSVFNKVNKSCGLENVFKIERQVHGDKCFVARTKRDKSGEADGLITNVKNITLATRVADCISVLMYDPVNNVIANIHSGWRGTIKRIAPKAVEKMHAEFKTNPSDLICVLCPSIGLDHFEVDKDVKDLFVAEFGEKYMYDLGEKTFIDAPRHLTESLSEVGVRLQNIHDSGICTVCNKELLHSYRADKELGQKYRNVALICLR